MAATTYESEPSKEIMNMQCRACEMTICPESYISLPCCQSIICIDCFIQHVQARVDGGSGQILCIDTYCESIISLDFASNFLEDGLKHKLEILTINAEGSKTRRSCPNCTTIHQIPNSDVKRMEQASRKLKGSDQINHVKCKSCSVVWCFYCYSPSHLGASCVKASTEKKFNNWMEDWNQSCNQRNAHRCPQCGIPTERNGGCPNMVCNQCSCWWCYDCGKRPINSKLLGNHGGNRWKVNACAKHLILGSNRYTRTLRWLKLIEEIGLIAICGAAFITILIPLIVPMTIVILPIISILLLIYINKLIK